MATSKWHYFFFASLKIVTSALSWLNQGEMRSVRQNVLCRVVMIHWNSWILRTSTLPNGPKALSCCSYFPLIKPSQYVALEQSQDLPVTHDAEAHWTPAVHFRFVSSSFIMFLFPLSYEAVHLLPTGDLLPSITETCFSPLKKLSDVFGRGAKHCKSEHFRALKSVLNQPHSESNKRLNIFPQTSHTTTFWRLITLMPHTCITVVTSQH